MRGRVCAHGDCVEDADDGGVYCSGHTMSLTVGQKRDLVALQIELRQNHEQVHKDRMHVLAAFGFSVATSAAALGAGAGMLGVAFAVGLVTGVYALAKGT